jgi:Predicted membrane protein (DUF2339)
MFELFSFLSFCILIYVVIKLSSIKDELNSIKAKLTELQKSTFGSINQSEQPKLEIIKAQANLEKEILHQTNNIEIAQESKDQKPKQNIYTYKEPIPSGPGPIVQFFQENFLIKLGSLFMIIGFGWFMTLAITNNWISPSLQILIALLIGLGVTAVGLNMNSKNSQTSSNQVFILTGTIINVLGFFAAHNIYNLITVETAVLAMIANIIIIGALACIKNYKSLAFAFQIGLFFVPFLVGIQSNNFLLSGIVGLLIAGLSLGVNYWKSWSSFNTSGIVLSAMFGISYAVTNSIWLSLLFVAVWFGCNFVTINKSGKINSLDIANIGLGSVFSIGIILSLPLDSVTRSFVLIGYGLLTSLITITLAQKSLLKKLGLVNLLASMFAFGIASLLFFGFGSIIGVLMVGILILIGSYSLEIMEFGMVTRRFVSSLNLLIIPLGAVFLIFNPNRLSLDNPTLFNATLLAGVYAILLFANMVVFNVSKFQDKVFGSIYMVLGGLASMSLVWNLANLLLKNYGNGLALFVFAFFGIAFLYNKAFSSQVIFKYASWFLIGFVIFRLFFVELWLMELPVRIGAFVAIGAMFLATAFIKKK